MEGVGGVGGLEVVGLPFCAGVGCVGFDDIIVLGEGVFLSSRLGCFTIGCFASDDDGGGC